MLYADFFANEEYVVPVAWLNACGSFRTVLSLMRPKPEQLGVLGHLLSKNYPNEEDHARAVDVVVSLITSLATHV